MHLVPEYVHDLFKEIYGSDDDDAEGPVIVEFNDDDDSDGGREDDEEDEEDKDEDEDDDSDGPPDLIYDFDETADPAALPPEMVCGIGVTTDPAALRFRVGDLVQCLVGPDMNRPAEWTKREVQAIIQAGSLASRADDALSG